MWGTALGPVSLHGTLLGALQCPVCVCIAIVVGQCLGLCSLSVLSCQSSSPSSSSPVAVVIVVSSRVLMHKLCTNAHFLWLMHTHGSCVNPQKRGQQNEATRRTTKKRSTPDDSAVFRVLREIRNEPNAELQRKAFTHETSTIVSKVDAVLLGSSLPLLLGRQRY